MFYAYVREIKIIVGYKTVGCRTIKLCFTPTLRMYGNKNFTNLECVQNEVLGSTLDILQNLVVKDENLID